jgi:hypothetical protein
MQKKRFFPTAMVLTIPILMVILLIGLVLPAAANPKDNWEQCANEGDALCEGKGNRGWITGKIGTNNGDYTIGDFIAYRAVRTDLVPDMRYCTGAWWDVAKATLPAIDYLGTYSLTVTDANALYDTSIPTGATPITATIPLDPILTGTYVLNGNPFSGTLPYGDVGDPGAQGWFSIWGGSDVNAKGYAINNPPSNPELTNGSQSIEICFTADSTDVVFAWGGHIANPSDWGASDRPTGSPYHMKTGTQSGFFTAPRTSENDLAEFDPAVCTDDFAPCPSANHYTIGSQDLQLGVDAPTAITLKSVSAGDGSDGLTLALIGVGVAALLSAVFILIRRQRFEMR